MPQATDKLRAKMADLFNDQIDDTAPRAFLENAGYRCLPDWTWYHPTKTELWEMTQDELACLMFLVEEFDYGGMTE